MDLNNLTAQPANLELVVHNFPAHKPHLRGRFAVSSGQTILSGQVCSVIKNTVTGRLEFIRGLDVDTDGVGADTALSKGDMIYIAQGNSTDGDVLNSGKLTGLSSVGGFELSTSRFDSGKTYQAGDYLVPDGLTGNLIPLPALTSGFTVDGGENIATFVVARVVADYAPPVDFAPSYTPNAGTANGVGVGVTGAEFTVGRRFGATNLQMLRIETIPPRPVTVTGS